MNAVLYHAKEAATVLIYPVALLLGFLAMCVIAGLVALVVNGPLYAVVYYFTH